MSKERAIRRAARRQAEQRTREERARAAARRAKRRALLRKLTPRLPRRRRTGRLYPRRTTGQRAAITCAYLAALVLIWLLVPGLGARIALTAVITVAAPAIVVLAFGRR